MPQQKKKPLIKAKPSKEYLTTPKIAAKAAADAKRAKSKAPTTATDRAKFAPGRGGLAAMAAKNKAAKAERAAAKEGKTPPKSKKKNKI